MNAIKKFQNENEQFVKANNYLRISNSEEAEDKSVRLYSPKSKTVYSMSSILELEYNGVLETISLEDWLMKDVLFLDQQRLEIGFYVCKSTLESIHRQLSKSSSIIHRDHFKRSLRLKHLIEFKNYPGFVIAELPYKEYPVEFYKWWLKDKSRIYMSNIEQIVLFNSVYLKNNSILQKRHLKMLGF